MKTLLLLRHAKSSRDDPGLSDFDRTLNDRGKDDAKLMGRYLRSQEFVVDGVISSPAKRAHRTTEIFLKAADVSLLPALDGRIYEASLQQLLTVVSEIGPSHNIVLLVGHNPGFEDLLGCLTDRAGRMPTASLAAIELDIDKWRDIAPRSGELSWLIAPKDLKS